MRSLIAVDAITQNESEIRHSLAEMTWHKTIQQDECIGSE
jgi:hypothetical protein